MSSTRGTESEPSRLLDLAFDAIFSIEMHSHRITYWNAGAERMYGFSRKEAVGSVSHELLRTRYPGSGRSAYDQVAQDGRWEGRLVQTRKDGAEILVDGRWVLDHTTAIVMEVNREVTDEVASAERFRLLVESVVDYAIFLLDTDGRVITWNAGARRTKGYSEEEIVGRHFSVFYPAEDVTAGKPARELAEATQNGSAEDEGWRVRKDGTRFWASVVITALRDPSGRLTGFAKVTRDLTAKEMERQRLLELEQAKSTFMNLVAHELRSPLTILRGYLSMFRDADPASRAKLEERALPALEAKTLEMSRLVDQMVEVARVEEGSIELRTEVVDLGSAAEKAAEGARMLAEGTLRIVFGPYPEELNVTGDPDRIRLILDNLLSNAIKYSPDGGEVTITLDRVQGFGRVAVADQGMGIPLEHQPKLFNRFTRFIPGNVTAVPGTGMGLYLSRELARRQGGDVVLLWSSPGGSSFGVLLPLA